MTTTLKKGIFTILFLFASVLIIAQKKQYLLKGKVQDSIEIVKNANIVNLKTKDGASSNDFGGFQILASIGDTLLISSLQHYTLYQTITKEDITNKELSIYLTSKRHQLKEIVLKKTNLTGSLILDMKRKKNDPKEINAVTLGLPFAGRKKLSQIDRKLHTATTSGGLVPLDLILNILSGRLKKLKEEKKIVEENNDVDAMMVKMKHFLASNFKIKEDDHFRFLYFCRSDSLFNKKFINNELDLIKFLHLKSKEFNKIQENELTKDK